MFGITMGISTHLIIKSKVFMVSKNGNSVWSFRKVDGIERVEVGNDFNSLICKLLV